MEFRNSWRRDGREKREEKREGERSQKERGCVE